MRDPLDPQNPYHGQYAAYDAWVYAHAKQQATPGLAQQRPGPSDQYYTLRVDSDGWPQPQRITQQHDLCDDVASPKPHCYNEIQAWGVMDQDMAEAQATDDARVRALSLPRIPQWLAQHPPVMALVLPDGEVVTEGPLGSAAAEAAAPEASTPARVFCRYSAAGVELGRTAPGDDWWTLYFSGFAALKARHSEAYWEESLGCVVRFDAKTGQPVEQYDYRGTRLKGTSPPAGRAPRDFTWLTGEQLADLYWQQNGGVQRNV